MYDIFKEKEQYNILMDKLKLQNKEYIKLQKSNAIQKEIVRERIRYSLTHLDINMAKRYIAYKIADKKVRKMEDEKHFKLLNTENTADFRADYFSKDKIVVYTVLFGGYDMIHEPIVLPDNVDFYLISDIDEIPADSVWKKFDNSKYKKYTDNLDGGMRNRWYKMHPHILFPNYQYSLYVDASIKIITDVTEHINKIGNAGISIHKHPSRDCVYDELAVVKCYGRDSMQNIMYTEKMYKSINFPRHYGLLENTIIARKHNEKKVIDIMDDWWKYINIYSRRDQLSLPVILQKHDVKIDEVCGLGNNIKENYAFRWESHIGYYDRIKMSNRKK